MEPLYVIAFLLAILVLLSLLRAIAGISDWLLRRNCNRRRVSRVLRDVPDSGDRAHYVAWDGRSSDKRGLV